MQCIAQMSCTCFGVVLRAGSEGRSWPASVFVLFVAPPSLPPSLPPSWRQIEDATRSPVILHTARPSPTLTWPSSRSCGVKYSGLPPYMSWLTTTPHVWIRYITASFTVRGRSGKGTSGTPTPKLLMLTAGFGKAGCVEAAAASAAASSAFILLV